MDMISFAIASRLIDRNGRRDLGVPPEPEPEPARRRRVRIAARVGAVAATLAVFVALMSAGAPAGPAAVGGAMLFQ